MVGESKGLDHLNRKPLQELLGDPVPGVVTSSKGAEALSHKLEHETGVVAIGSSVHEVVQEVADMFGACVSLSIVSETGEDLLFVDRGAVTVGAGFQDLEGAVLLVESVAIKGRLLANVEATGRRRLRV